MRGAQEGEAAGGDHRRPPPRDAQDRLQLGARGGAAPGQPGAARQEPARAAPEDAPRVEHGGDREHRDQGARPAGPRRRRARRLLRPAGGGGRGTLWSDLDLARGFVTVCRTIEEDDDGTLLEYPPKNGKARTVPLPAAACDELRVWLAAQKEYRLAQGPAWNEAGRVVPKKDGTQMAPSTLKSQWWNWVARQRIDPHLPIHGLRDSFGTWVYETYGVKQAQEWLGHSDPATTLRHYVRLTTAARAKAVAGLDEVTRAALEGAERRAVEDAQPALDNVVSLASRRRPRPLLDPDSAGTSARRGHCNAGPEPLSPI